MTRFDFHKFWNSSTPIAHTHYTSINTDDIFQLKTDLESPPFSFFRTMMRISGERLTFTFCKKICDEFFLLLEIISLFSVSTFQSTLSIGKILLIENPFETDKWFLFYTVASCHVVYYSSFFLVLWRNNQAKVKAPRLKKSFWGHIEFAPNIKLDAKKNVKLFTCKKNIHLQRVIVTPTQSR